MTTLTPEHFDTLTRAHAPAREDKIIWTLPAIAGRIGVGVDFVRDTLARQPNSPVRELGGRYYAFDDELIAFLRGQAKPTLESPK